MWYEYLDHQLVAASIMGFISTSLLFINSKHPQRYILLSTALWIGINILSCEDIESSIKSNTALFQKGALFTCKGDDHNLYRVSNNEWQLYKESFIKESLMIRADKCEVK